MHAFHPSLSFAFPLRSHSDTYLPTQVFTFAQGLKVANDGLSADKIVLYYARVTVAPFAFLFFIFLIGCGSLGFSTIFFLPASAFNLAVFAVIYEGLLLMSRKSGKKKRPGRLKQPKDRSQLPTVSTSPLTITNDGGGGEEEGNGIELHEVYRDSRAELPALKNTAHRGAAEEKSSAENRQNAEVWSAERASIRRNSRLCSWFRKSCRVIWTVLGGMALGALCSSFGFLKGSLW